MAKDGAASAALTPADYHTAEAFDRERRTLFARAWTPVCRASALVPGAQRAAMVGAQPVLVTRDLGGALHALSNVCRHRGMTLVEGEAHADVVRCPYHLWTYGLDGALQAAPFMQGVDLGGCDLPRYRAAEWGGWVFVNLDRGAPSLETELAPLCEALDPDRIAGLEVGFTLTFEHAWNWKVMLENFGESYHHIGTHAGTLQPLWPGGQTDSSVSTDRWLEIRHPEHPSAGTLRVFVVFPLLLLALTPSDGAVIWYRMTPTGPERIALEVVGLYPPALASDAERMQSARASVFAVHQEDMAVCERVQAGLRAPDAVLGPLSPLEAGIARFREWVGREVART
ncbi:MAG TPA: aromatic ring-hydroxylating dioxygenase subunit alpha [Caulobacteraceae bacterium]|nr:aromatic ring-hydroxylating dioxygenase subunit alpha [Caulobacteraceae bacterium]